MKQKLNRREQRKKTFCVWVLCLSMVIFGINFGSAWSNSTFNNSLSEENITFFGDQNFTRWLSVPENRIATSGFMNLSGLLIDTKTHDTFTGEGEFINIGAIAPRGGILFNLTGVKIDFFGSWIAEISALGNLSVVYRNISDDSIIYSKNMGVVDDVVSSTVTYNEYDISDSPLITEPIYILFERTSTSGNIRFYINTSGGNDPKGEIFDYFTPAVYNTIDYILHPGGDSPINITFEDGFGFPINPYININDTRVWNYTGAFNITEQTSNFATTINSYLSSCTILNGFCLVPFIFHSDTAGILRYFNLIFNNDGFIENSQTFNNETIEGATETFTLNMTYESIEFLSSLDVKLVYNGTEHSAAFLDTGNNLIISKSIIIPEVSADTNVTFYWDISTTEWEQNSTKNNQTILNFGIDNCTSFTNKIISLTLRDEELQTTIANGTIEIAVNIFSQDRSILILNISDSYFNINPTEICLNVNLSEGSKYLLDSVIRYEATNYANEYYNIVGLELTNDTELQNISLFDLNSSDSTEFHLTFKGEDFLPVEDALVFIERQYIAENTFKTVELPKTDANGQTVLHLVRNEVVYNIIVIKDNLVLGSFNNIIAFCQDFTIGSCTINLNAISNESGIFNYDNEVGIIYNSIPDYDTTSRIVSFSFVSTDGTEKSVFMNVERRDIFGNRSVCNNTVTSSGGTLSCTVGEEIDDTTLFTMISIDGEEWLVFSTIIDDTAYGSTGYVFWFFMTLALILMFGESKNGIMISLLVSYIGAIALGIGIGGVVGIGSAGIWIMSITATGIWKINKNRKR